MTVPREFPGTAEHWKALQGAVWASMGTEQCDCDADDSGERICQRCRGPRILLEQLLRDRATDGKPTLIRWIVWRETPYLLRAAREPLE
jgi:hypothetical protein